MPSFSVLRTIATLSLTLVLGLARAQESEPYDADPPDRAARLSFIEGDVSMQPAGEEAWATAILNRPLTTGDSLWTEQGARAEIQVGQAAVRLDGDTGFSFLNIDDDTIQMRMTAGVMNVRMPHVDNDEQIEVDTPKVALSLPASRQLSRRGRMRRDDTTVVKVSEGEAEATVQGAERRSCSDQTSRHLPRHRTTRRAVRHPRARRTSSIRGTMERDRRNYLRDARRRRSSTCPRRHGLRGSRRQRHLELGGRVWLRVDTVARRL